MGNGQGDLPLVERKVVRLAVLDASNHVLLLQTRDLGNPAFGTSWELPGGGMADGETFVDTAIGELREETGIRICLDSVGTPTWRRDVSYTYRGERRLQHELIAAVHLHEVAPVVESSQRVDFEIEDHFGFRWWRVDDIVCSSERFYPRRLPALLARFLVGDEIEEPMERWP
jgi:8-oxo-dGTP pyrophosphatase MutT (NUDIX family)